MFIAVQFCKFGFYLIRMIRSRLSVLVQFKIVAKIQSIQIKCEFVAIHQGKKFHPSYKSSI